MIYKMISALIMVFMFVSAADSALGQQKALSSKSGKTTHKYGGQKKSSSSNNLFNKHQQFHNKYYKSHKDFNNKYYQPHPGTKAYNQKYYGNKGYGKKHHHKKHKKNHYGYKPYGGYVYYGYNDYYYDDVPYDGYGSTLGTVPQRPSNLDVNNYVYRPDYDNYDPGYYPQQQYDNPADYSYGTQDYYNEPEPERGTIYVWTDEYGVEHFVNDPDLVPDQFWGDVRVVDEY